MVAAQNYTDCSQFIGEVIILLFATRAMDELLEAIYNLSLIDDIRVHLQRCPPDSAHLRDSDGLDPIHHAILAGNTEAVSLLRLQPFLAVCGDGDNSTIENTVRAEDASGLGYLHLACLVGNVFIVQSLVATGDCNRLCRSWPKPEALRRCLQRKSGCKTSEDILTTYDAALATLSSMPNGATALDAAAVARNSGCVRLLLGDGNTTRKHTELEMAMEARSSHAFMFLLSLEPERKDIENAFKQALTQKRPDCLRMLLSNGVDVTSALNSLNPFHVAYVYSSGFHQLSVTRTAGSSVGGVERAGGGGLEEITALLIERGFDVNVRAPLGTYPLYSLITSLVLEKDSKPSQVPISHIRSLDLLLKAGARTDFNESRLAAELTPDSPPPVMGRDLFSSALDAYFTSLQSCDTWRPHVMEHLDRVCLSLLEAGADPNHFDSSGETSLHRLMRAMACQHAMGHMHADLSCMCRMLLYFGADPNQRCERGVWPVQLYFSVLLRSMGGLFAFRRWKCSDNASQVLQLLYFMDTPDACQATACITSELNGAAGEGMPTEVVQFVVGLMAEYVCCVKSLQELSRLALWKAVSRKLVNLKKLHMPRAFIAAIKELFHMDI